MSVNQDVRPKALQRSAGKSHRVRNRRGSREIEACRQWLNAEIRSLGPQLLVCLGGTAVRSVFGNDLPVLKNRGCWMTSGHMLIYRCSSGGSQSLG
jgi:uracil-DNA glycosylase